MNIKILVEVNEQNVDQLLDHLHTHPFVENAEIAEAHTILNPRLLQSIENYETGKIKPTPIGLEDLKDLINA